MSSDENEEFISVVSFEAWVRIHPEDELKFPIWNIARHHGKIMERLRCRQLVEVYEPSAHCESIGDFRMALSKEIDGGML